MNGLQRNFWAVGWKLRLLNVGEVNELRTVRSGAGPLSVCAAGRQDGCRAFNERVCALLSSAKGSRQQGAGADWLTNLVEIVSKSDVSTAESTSFTRCVLVLSSC